MEGKSFHESITRLVVAQNQRQPVPDDTLEVVLRELAREFPRSTIAVATAVWTALMVGAWAGVLYLFRMWGVLGCLVIGPMTLMLTVTGYVFIAGLASSRKEG